MAELNTLPIEYNVEEAYVAELKEKYSGLKIVDNASYETVKEGIKEFRTIRTGVEKRRKELKAGALEFGKKVDTEAKRLTALVAPTEDELKAEKKKEDDKEAEIQAEKDRIEKERVSKIFSAIIEIRDLATGVRLKSAPELQELMDTLSETPIDEEHYMEFVDKAIEAVNETFEIINNALTERIKLDEEEVAHKAEAERLEAIRLEQEAEQKRLDDEKAKQEAEAQAERDRIAEAQRKIDDEKAKIEAGKKAEQERKDREEFERQAKEDARIKAEKNAKAQAEREELKRIEEERVEKEKAEREERERIAKEKAEKEEAERQEALKPDRDKLLSLVATLEGLSFPELNSPEADSVLSEAVMSIGKTIDNLISGVEGL